MHDTGSGADDSRWPVSKKGTVGWQMRDHNRTKIEHNEQSSPVKSVSSISLTQQTLLRNSNQTSLRLKATSIKKSYINLNIHLSSD